MADRPGTRRVAERHLDVSQGLRSLPPDGFGGLRAVDVRGERLGPGHVCDHDTVGSLSLLVPGQRPLLLGQHGQLGPHEAMREPGPRQPVLHEGAGQG